jgi:hypothetical protein
MRRFSCSGVRSIPRRGAPPAVTQKLKVVSFAANERAIGGNRAPAARPRSHPKSWRPSGGTTGLDLPRKAPGPPRFSPGRCREPRHPGSGVAPAVPNHVRAGRPTPRPTGPCRPAHADRPMPPAHRDSTATARIYCRPPRSDPISGQDIDHQLRDISSASALKWRNPLFVQPEADGPRGQLRRQYSDVNRARDQQGLQQWETMG